MNTFPSNRDAPCGDRPLWADLTDTSVSDVEQTPVPHVHSACTLSHTFVDATHVIGSIGQGHSSGHHEGKNPPPNLDFQLSSPASLPL